MSVTVRGAGKLSGVLKNFPVDRISDAILAAMGQIIYLYSQHYVPWKTGRLQRSAWYEKVTPLEHILHYDAPYADVVEMGRRDRPYRNTPYIRPSIGMMERLMTEHFIRKLIDFALF
jgi:hypothetical protein